MTDSSEVGYCKCSLHSASQSYNWQGDWLAYDVELRPAGRKQFAAAGTALTTYSYDPNGNLILVNDPLGTGVTTMAYDKENRLAFYQNGAVSATYLYSGDNLKRVENVNGVLTTLVWDGPDYLQGRS